MIDKNEASEAVKRIDKIIQEWEENRIGDHETIELLIPDLKTIICYVEKIQDKADEACYKKKNDMEENKRNLCRDLEEELDDEAGREFLVPEEEES